MPDFKVPRKITLPANSSWTLRYKPSLKAPDRIAGPPSCLREAVPMRGKPPRKGYPLQVMIMGVCPQTGGGLLHCRWKTRKNIVMEREWHIHRGLPGEIVELVFSGIREKRYPKGDMELFTPPEVATVERSPFEVRASCPHFNVCGGCDFQHLSYSRQLVEKQRWVQRAILNAKVPPSVLERIRPCGLQNNYAYRTEWHFSEEDDKLRFGPSADGPAGRLDDPPSECLLPSRAAVRSLTVFHEAFMEMRAAGGEAYSIYEEKRGLGTLKSVIALSTRAMAPGTGIPGRRNTQVLLNLVLAQEIDDIEAVLGPLVRRIVDFAPRCLSGIVANVARSKKDVMGGRREYLLYGRRYIQQSLRVPLMSGKHDFVIDVGAGTRLLAPPRLLPEVAHAVAEFAGAHDDDVVWHCFCGGGDLSLAVGATCKHVVAIGTSAAEVSELKRTLAANDVGNTTAVLANLRSPWTLKHLAFHITQSQQRRLLLGSGDEQQKAREYALTAFVPGESRRRQMQRLSAGPFTFPLLRKDAMAHKELRLLLPAFVRDFRLNQQTTLPVPVNSSGTEKTRSEVSPEMEPRLKRLYRRLALKYHPDRNPNDPEASERFQALTRAYRSLVGPDAGPQEEDEEAEDPFIAAKNNKYRLKFKHRWSLDSTRPPGKKPTQPTAPAEPLAMIEGMTSEAPEEEPEEALIHVSDEEDEDFAVRIDIDDAFAQGSRGDATAGVGSASSHGFGTYPPEASDEIIGEVPEVVVYDGDAGVELAGGAVPPPETLPPPDIIIVTQPRNRKPGAGTKSYFRHWMRSTAARVIVYVATCPEAFEEDLCALMELGYGLRRVRPFDIEPHRRSVLLVARLELLRPLSGAEEYFADGSEPALNLQGMLPGGAPLPLLGSGGYSVGTPRLA